LSRFNIGLALFLALTAFAANSVLCRLALGGGHIEAGSFTSVRILSGALLLMIVAPPKAGHLLRAQLWFPACMLFAYAACFSFAYVRLNAGTGALLLFGAVQFTMLGGGIYSGERLQARSAVGWILACAGIAYLLLPGAERPPIGSAMFMLCAGIAWGAYSLIGKRSSDPIAATARNFMLAAVPSSVLFLVCYRFENSPDAQGLLLAAVSGSITSGLGYIAWYSALRHVSSLSAAIAQLTVPVIAAAGGVAFLSEAMSPRLAVASILTLGGVGLALSAQIRGARRTT
jgi:drug/metabolite transporter (DMT)-like permease